MDSRDQGRSGDSSGKITYEKMTDDLAALLGHLNTGPVNVLGWSDGGIEALLLAIRHPAKVKKIAAMAANLNPSEHALYPEIIAVVKSMIEAIPAAARNTPQGKRELKVTSMNARRAYGAVLPHAVREEGPDQRHYEVLRETSHPIGAAPAVNWQPYTRSNNRS